MVCDDIFGFFGNLEHEIFKIGSFQGISPEVSCFFDVLRPLEGSHSRQIA